VMKDPYSVIGVGKNATVDEIKKAYRSLAKKLHPDVNPGDISVEKRFKEVSAAYRLLSDVEQRAKFDRGEIKPDGSPSYENLFRSNQGARHRSGSEGGFSFGQGGSDFDLFSDLFGNHASQRRRPAKGRNLSSSLNVSLEDAAKGLKRRIKISGNKVLDVKVPPGTTDGQVLRLKGQGEPGILGGPVGDAMVTIRLDTHPFFTLNGRDIYLIAPISLDEAVLGAKITVPTIDGKVALSVPKNTSSGLKLRLRGKGLAPKGKKAGDLIVTLNIVLPDTVDSELEAFINKWSGGEGEKLRKKLGLND